MFRAPTSLFPRALAGFSVLALTAGLLTVADFDPPAATASAEGCTIIGTDGPDVLTGTEADDVICADGGDDVIRALGGADRIDAGDGDDVIEAGGGDDTVAAGYGDDTVSGGTGRDTIDGGPGNDTVLGGAAIDTIAAGTGDDLVFGGAATDIIDGGTGTDVCNGGTGWNVMANCDTATQSSGPDVDGPADTDGDLLPDDAELRFGSDPAAADSDDDGLSDLDELLGMTDPRTADADADVDGDGLDASAEVAHGTDPLSADTDGDSLADHAEIIAGTDPLAADTDGDSVSDADEAVFNTDPLVADSDGDGISDGDDTFTHELTLADIGATFTAEGTPAALLAVSLHESGDDRLQDVPGQRAPPVEVVAPLALTSGTLRIPFDTTGLAADAEVAVLHFDDDSDTFDIPTNQTVDLATGIATVTTSDFSPFVVVDLAQLRSIWASEIKTPREGDANARSVDVVLTIDSSGSMTSNDPSGLRRTAAKSFVDALLNGDRAAVVDFDSSAFVRQTLTTDFAAVKSAIGLIDSSGGTSLSAGMNAALNELDAHGDPEHSRIIVFLTDGDGSYSSSYTARAAQSGTTVYTVGLGTGSSTTVLNGIATSTGGQFFYVASASQLPDTFDRIGDDIGAPDADGDGLADVTESAGWRDGSGRIYKTDPQDADSDGDGLTDGDEAGQFRSGGALGVGTYYAAISNPNRIDSDFDGLDDAEELGYGTSAWKADLDYDGLNDSAEVETYSTEPFSSDTDVDGHSDSWEITHASEGYDPLFADRTVTPLEIAGDFARGALCGDIEGFWGFCGDDTTIAYFVGVVASGIVVVGDVRDIIANVVKADFVSAGLNLIALVPALGDGASIVVKGIKFISKSTKDTGPVVRVLMKEDSVLGDAEKITVLRAVAGNAVDRLKAAGVSDASIAKIASRASNAKHLDEVFAGASAVKKGGAFYTREKPAEQFLRATEPGAFAQQRLTKLIDEDGTISTRRFYDVLTRDGKAIEVKHGITYGVGRAGSQLVNDAKVLAARLPDVNRVEWHFFPNANGTVGPDATLLALLKENNIPYTIWVP